MEGISVRFGCDPVIYPPPAPGVFPYYTERIYLFRLSTGAVAISSMIGVVNFYPTTKWYTNDTIGCFCLGTGFSFGRSVSDCIKTFKLGDRFTPTCRCSQYIRGTSLISHATAACLFLGPAYMLLRWNSFETLFYQRTSIEQMDCVTQLKKSPIPTDEISNPNRTEFSTTTTDVK